MASQNGHHRVVLSLLGAGADVNIAESDVSEFKFMTSGHIAVLTGWSEGGTKHSNNTTCKYYNTIDTRFALLYKKTTCIR